MTVDTMTVETMTVETMTVETMTVDTMTVEMMTVETMPAKSMFSIIIVYLEQNVTLCFFQFQLHGCIYLHSAHLFWKNPWSRW